MNCEAIKEALGVEVPEDEELYTAPKFMEKADYYYGLRDRIQTATKCWFAEDDSQAMPRRVFETHMEDIRFLVEKIPLAEANLARSDITELKAYVIKKGAKMSSISGITLLSGQMNRFNHTIH